MAMTIDSGMCTACGDCEPVCPTHAISPKKGVYFINADTCTECEGEHDLPQCLNVCTADCISPLD